MALRRTSSLIALIVLAAFAGRYWAQHHADIESLTKHPVKISFAILALVAPALFVIWAVIRPGRIKTVVVALLGLLVYPVLAATGKYIHGTALHLLWFVPVSVALIFMNLELPKRLRTHPRFVQLASKRGWRRLFASLRPNGR